MKTTTYARVHSAFALLITTLVPAVLPAADVAFMAVFKNQVFEQQNPFVPNLKESHQGNTNDFPVKLGVFIEGTGANTITSATLDHPGGTGVPVPPSGNSEG